MGLLRSPAGASSLATKNLISHKAHKAHKAQESDLEGNIQINPLDLARSWHSPKTLRRSSLSMRLQRVISSTVR
ncbi:hypothetical protein OU5_2386 [Pseudomonas mandelii JR-1]|uniref:Uncharacterized protein n=1 Tax=Pseudomonas mandelii JR-1 TaxID=1147786 RepID=A0A024EA53_9PSED|nr:hypothetical protein OU5_2386 [Pseudomonas mandelii JR-1]